MRPAHPEVPRFDHATPRRSRAEIRARFAELLAEVDRVGLRRLSSAKVEEIGRSYRAVASQLELQRAFGASAARRDELNRLVARGHAILYGRQAGQSGLQAWRHQLLMIPVTVRKSARYHTVAALLMLIGAVYGYFGAAADPDWSYNFAFPGDERTPYATRAELLETLHHGRQGEVAAGENAAFASMLWINNTRVALMAFFVGFLAGIPAALLLLMNGAVLGSYSQTFHAKGLAFDWWAWILPHGITELLAVVLLAGGGLWIGHRVVAPGDMTRAERFREMRGDLARLVLLTFPMMLAAALIESFVRQSRLGDAERYAFAAVTAVFWIWFLGRVGRSHEREQPAVDADDRPRRRIAMPEISELAGPLR